MFDICAFQNPTRRFRECFQQVNLSLYTWHDTLQRQFFTSTFCCSFLFTFTDQHACFPLCCHFHILYAQPHLLWPDCLPTSGDPWACFVIWLTQSACCCLKPAKHWLSWKDQATQSVHRRTVIITLIILFVLHVYYNKVLNKNFLLF